MNDPKKVLTDVFTSLAAGNSEKLEKQFTDDFKTTVMNNPVDRKQYISAFNSLHKAIPDLEINLHDVEATGNKVHAFLNLSGTHSGEISSDVPGFSKITPTGKKINAENVELEISMMDDRIKEIRSVNTGKGVFNQIFTQLSN